MVAYVVGGIMAIGAVFGALNTMFSAVGTRSREIATLRAIGFAPVSVVVSVLVEALLLALLGGVCGALIAWLLFNGHSVDTRRRRYGRATHVRPCGHAGPDRARHRMGMSHRRDRRSVPGDSRSSPAGCHCVAGGLGRASFNKESKVNPVSKRATWTTDIALIVAAGVFAGGHSSAEPVPAQAAHPLTVADAEAWLDGLLPTALNTAQVPGAVVVIVKDGQVLIEKGYGFSDYEKRVPVDPRATLFRPGSTSKLFTWTAVMQLVEHGKLDLDADVNRYLDFNVPARHGIPVTLREIMTHRAGFEETAQDLVTFGETTPALGDVVKRYVPPRILDPGEGPAYSNYATALAGYIVQRISGEAYDEYIRQHILMPLDMKNSTFRQPLPEAMRPHMSKGYETWDKPGAGYEIVSVAPAGALASTGEDMAHFMIAHLQLGRYGDGEILKPDTARLMQSTITKALPDLNGNALGFYEQNVNGHRVIAHGGDTNYFHTDLTLFPDDHVGLFISVNAKGREGLGEFVRQSLFDEFSDRYFPGVPSTARVDDATAKAHAAMIAGAYINTRRADSTFISLIKLIGTDSVTANADGTISAAPVGQMETFVEVKPFLWQQVGGHDRIQAIVRDRKVVRWSSTPRPPSSSMKDREAWPAADWNCRSLAPR